METFIATNGKRYYIDPETGTAKRFDNYDRSGFTENRDAHSLDEEAALENTKVLLKYLKKFYPEATRDLKSGYIKVRGYRIKYLSHGFVIQDTLDNFKTVNVNEWNNDFPDPDSVLTWLRQAENKPVVKSDTPVEKAILVEKLAKKFKVKVESEKKEKEKKEETRDELLKKLKEEKPRLVTPFERILNYAATPKKEFNPKQFIKLCEGFSKKKSFLFKLRNLASRFVKSLDITNEKFIADLRTILTEMMQPAPPEEPRLTRIPKCAVAYFPKNLKISENPKRKGMLLYEFDQEQPDGSFVKMKVDEPLYYLNQVHYYCPKAVPVLFAIARGEVIANRAFLDSFDFVSLEHGIPPCRISENVILESDAIPSMILFCEELFRYKGVLLPSDMQYNLKGINVRDNVLLFYPTSKLCFEARVTAINPLRCAFSDGLIETVSNTVEVKKR